MELSDFDAIRIIGHNMKGSGSGYGLDAITDIGDRLEQTAIQGAWDEIRILTAKLSHYLGALQLEYE